MQHMHTHMASHHSCLELLNPTPVLMEQLAVVGGCCPVPESAGKGMNLTIFLGESWWERNNEKTLLLSDVVAAPVPPPPSQLRASPSSPPAPMGSPRFPADLNSAVSLFGYSCSPELHQDMGHSLTSKSQPSPFPHQPTPPVLTTQSILLPPQSIKSCLILCGSSFLTTPTELLCHSILWPPCSSFWNPLLWRKETHFFLSNCDVLGAQKGHNPAFGFSSWPKYHWM